MIPLHYNQQTFKRVLLALYGDFVEESAFSFQHCTPNHTSTVKTS